MLSVTDRSCVFSNKQYKSHGAFAEYLVVRGDAQMKIPDNVTDEDAAAQGVAIGTMVCANIIPIVMQV